MPRCPDCNKFVPIELGDPDDAELEVTELAARQDIAEKGGHATSIGTVSCEARLVLQCGECGTELSEANFDTSEGFELEHAKESCKGQLEVEQNSFEADDSYEGKGRGAKHFYHGRVNCQVSCSDCEAEVEVEIEFTEQASSFESLV